MKQTVRHRKGSIETWESKYIWQFLYWLFPVGLLFAGFEEEAIWEEQSIMNIMSIIGFNTTLVSNL